MRNASRELEEKAGCPHLVAIAILAVVLAVYGRTLGNGFVSDDHRLIERSAVVRTLDPAAHLGAPFWAKWGAAFEYYRPLATWSLAFNRAVSGTRPFGYHLANLLLHAAAAFLLFAVLRRIAGRSTAFVAALIFAVHPVGSESVAWVLGRTDLLAAVFVLLATWLHAGVPDRPRGGDLARYGGTIAALAAGLLSKESAVTFPAFAVAVDLAAARSRGASFCEAAREAGRRLLRLGPGYLAAIAGYLILRRAVLGSLVGPGFDEEAGEVFVMNPLVGASAGARVLTAVDVAARYLRLLVFPRTLTMDYSFDSVPVVRSAASAAFAISAIAVAAALMLAVLAARRRPAALFGVLVAVAAYLPFGNWLFAGSLLMAERMLYLPMAGIAAVAAAVVVAAADRWAPPARHRAAVAAIAAVLVAPLAARSFVRGADWKDDAAIYRSAVAASPRSALAWGRLAAIQAERGEVDEALASARKAEEILPGYSVARVNRAVAFRKVGRLDEAERELRAVLKGQPAHLSASMLLVAVLSKRAEEAQSAGRDVDARRLREDLVALVRARAPEAERNGLFAVAASFRLESAGSLVTLDRRDEAEENLTKAKEDAAREAAIAPEPGGAAKALQGTVLGALAQFRREQGRASDAASLYREASLAAEQGGERLLAAGMSANEGDLLVGLALPSDAAAAYGRALELAVGSPLAARFALSAAEASIRAREPGRALALYDRLLSTGQPTMRAYHGRARAKLALGDTAGAERDLLAALGLEEGQPQAAVAEVWYEMGTLARDRGDAAEAHARFERCVALRPDHAGAREALAAQGP